MNSWDKVFWMMFVLLEAAIILGNVWAFSPLGVILGFVLIAAAFARIGDNILSARLHSRLGSNTKTIEKMRSWMNNHYELTRSIKDLHDHRIQKMETKKTDIDEKVEKNYREIVGKIIDLENRLNLVSRAVISQKGGTPVTKQVEKTLEKPVDMFESVWNDIVEVAKRRDSISTLSRGVKNRIVNVKDDMITLRSELTKKERSLMKEEFRRFWEILYGEGKLNFLKDIKDPKLVRVGSVIISFLARLPNVEHQLKPRVLYLMDKNTHNQGTLKTYGK